MWRHKWPVALQPHIITDNNPNGTITVAQLELAGALLQHEAAAQCFDIRERTILSRTDNLNALFWSRKGSATDDRQLAALLRALAITTNEITPYTTPYFEIEGFCRGFLHVNL